MTIHLFIFENSIEYFWEGYEKDFSEIYDQLTAEYLFGGFNKNLLVGYTNEP